MPTPPPVKARQGGLDSIRGAALVSMTAYHTAWDLVWIFGLDWPWYHGFGAYLWQQSICWTFILLSGWCWSLGRRQFRRGVTVFCAGGLVTAATALLMPENLVFCGVLTLLGASAILLVPLDRVLQRLPPRMGLAGSFTAFLLLRDVNGGFLGFEGGRIAALPREWYRNWFTALLGFPPDWFYSTDYFSLLPWFFLFLTGYFLKRVQGGQPPERERTVPGLCALGRHSLPIYLLHQPVIYGILLLIFHG